MYEEAAVEVTAATSVSNKATKTSYASMAYMKMQKKIDLIGYVIVNYNLLLGYFLWGL